MYTDTVTTEATYYYKVVAMRLNEKGKRVRGKVSVAQVTVGVVSTSVTVTVTDCPVNGIDVSKWHAMRIRQRSIRWLVPV